MIAQVVYILCGLTSVMCAILLLRAFSSSRSTLLFFSGICFVLLAVSNVLLFVDLVLTPPDLDLSILRNSITALAHIVLLVGLIWRSENL